MKTNFVLSISGIAGSRKTTFLRQLQAWLNTQKHIECAPSKYDEHSLLITYKEQSEGLLNLHTGMFIQNTITDSIYLVTEDGRLVNIKDGFYYSDFRTKSLSLVAWKEIGGPDA